MKQPDWHGPFGSSELRVLNSLTSSVVPFVPAAAANAETNKDSATATGVSRRVNWYTCGPTVYDSAHLGHARCYVTMDIIRRLMTDYFKYDVFYVMNITDLDDKIIIRSRRNYLLKQYSEKASDPTQVATDIESGFHSSLEKQRAKVSEAQRNLEESTKTGKYVEDNKVALEEEQAKLNLIQSEYDAYKKVVESSANGNATDRIKALLAAGKGPLSEYLDSAHGDSVTDHSIFKKHAQYFEREFLQDMRELGVRDADAITRVTEYVDKIIAYVQGIMSNGFAYESQGSVYFDTAAFTQAGFHYAKLNPWCVGNTTLTAGGEGALSVGDASGKKNGMDFALWKKSKKGEPHWPSPWGEGRPGWHIECSAMASDLLGTSFDVHSGGVDLRFPHHDNEIAQSEGHSRCKQWVNHFWHAGHLNIAGLKMSKSLKNFITIRDVLRRYSGRTVRFLFLMTPWHSTMNFSDDALKAASTREKEVSEFFSNNDVALRAREKQVAARGEDAPEMWSDADRALHAKLREAKSSVHQALCDNFDYPRALQLISDLITETNKYRSAESATFKVVLLNQIGRYVENMMRVFGVIPDSELGLGDHAASAAAAGGSQLASVLDALCSFRDAVREAARANKGQGGTSAAEMLALCDKLRDETMLELGVRMEDVSSASSSSSSGGASSPSPSPAGGLRSVWKLDDPDKLKRERDERRREELSNRRTKLQNKLDKLQKDLTKLQESSIDAKQFFAAPTQREKYSAFDEQGKPTLDAEGKELTKSALKAINKVWEARDKAHKDYLNKIEKNPTLLKDLEQEIQNLTNEKEKIDETIKQQQEQQQQ